jgi:pyrimidine-nucleoside phosphorylase
MNQIDIIKKKQHGSELQPDELQFLIRGYVDGSIPDHQIAAFLMAVYFQGMSDEEVVVLTGLMRDSGVVLDLKNIDGIKVDKHSTGGVGDKISLILAPLAACAGLIVPMMSGRALAHTGGTLDKLAAIPGFRTDLTLEEIHKQLQSTGIVLVGQTDELCPADKKIYALRDATATVACIPLITASIISKKLSEGIDALVLDVKSGDGAIFSDAKKSRPLATKLIRTADRFGLRSSAILTDMNAPLGYAIGNWLETHEAIQTLQGHGPRDVETLSLVLGAQMLMLSGTVTTITEGMHLLKGKLDSGLAFEKFLQVVAKQGGDTGMVEHPEKYRQSKFHKVIKSDRSGVIAGIKTREIGEIAMALGAGRNSIEQSVDTTSGIVLATKVGSAVKAGDTVAIAHAEHADLLDRLQKRLQDAFIIADAAEPAQPLIHSLIDVCGEKKWHPHLRKFE